MSAGTATCLRGHQHGTNQPRQVGKEARAKSDKSYVHVQNSRFLGWLSIKLHEICRPWAGLSKVGGKSALLEGPWQKGDKFRGVFTEDLSLLKQKSATAAVELSAEQEGLAQRIYAKLQATMDQELLAMARLMASQPDHELLGRGEFQLRDKLNEVGARCSRRPPTSG